MNKYSHLLTSLFENTHIFAQIFSSENTIVIFICKLCLQTAKRVYKNQKLQYNNLQHKFAILYFAIDH